MATKHTHAPNFGRKIDGCPRCEELKAGAAPIVWAGMHSGEYSFTLGRYMTHKEAAAKRMHDIRTHDCRANRCGPVCTAFQW